MNHRVFALVLCLSLMVGPARADDTFLAASFFRQGKYQKTLDAIDRLTQTEGASAISPSLLFTKAQCLASLDRPKEAIDTLDDLLRRFPTSSFASNARTKLAQVLEDQKLYKQLIERLQVWAKEETGTNTWSRLLARAYVRDNRADEAIRFLAGSADPNNIQVLFEILNEAGKLDAYMLEAEKAPEATYESERRLGTLLGLKKDWARARSHFDKARAIRPADPDLLVRMIQFAQDGRDLESAIRYAKDLAASEPGNTAHVKRLGELQLAAGRKDEALGTWNQLRTKSQRDRGAHQLYVSVLADHGLTDEAITGIEGARKVFDDATLFAEDLGRLYERQGNVYAATREYLSLFDAPGDKAPALVLSMVKRAAPKRAGATLAPTLPPTASTTTSTSATAPAAPAWPALTDATRAVTEATRARSGTIELFYLLDDLYQLSPDPALIAQLCRELVQQNTSRTDAVVKAARDFAAEHRQLEARTVLSEVLPHLQAPDTWEISLELARLERQAGHFDEALKALEGLATTAAPDSVTIAARTLQAEILLRDRRDAAAARKLLGELLARFPEQHARAQWTFLLACCALANLEVGEAAKLLAQVEPVADGALLPEVVFREAQLDLLTDRLDGARDRLQTLVVKYPASPLAQPALRDIFFLSTRKAELQAAEPSKTSTAPTPVTTNVAPATALPEKPSLIAEFFLQRHLIDAGRFADFDARAAKMDPAKLPPSLKADFQLLAALAHRARGEFAKAVEALEKLAKTLPEGPVLEDALLLRAEILEKDLGDHGRADAVYDDYLMLYPNSVRAEEVRRKLEGTGNGTISGQNTEQNPQ